MLVKIEARILIFPGTDFYFPSTSVPPGTFLGSAGWAKTLHEVQIIMSMQPFQIKLNGFHRNIPKVSENKD